MLIWGILWIPAINSKSAFAGLAMFMLLIPIVPFIGLGFIMSFFGRAEEKKTTSLYCRYISALLIFIPITLWMLIKFKDPLHFAASEGYESTSKILIAYFGADVNGKNKYGRTPLHNARTIEIAELLINNGADVNALTYYWETTPLDSAIKEIERGQSKEVAALIRKHGGKSGAELFIHIAAQSGNIEAVKKHIANGVDVNSKKRGKTPLHEIAIQGEFTEIAAHLIAAGAEVNAKTTNKTTSYSIGSTPLDLAIKTRPKNTKIIDLLLKNGGTYGTIHSAVRDGNISAVRDFIDNGVDVNSKKRGATPLYIALERNHKEIAALIRQHGGKTNEELRAEAK